jgi:hypothetical protein
MNIEERLAAAKDILGEIKPLPPKTRCLTGKGMHQTKAQAESMAKIVMRRRSAHGQRLNVYQCKECNFWHLTREN